MENLFKIEEFFTTLDSKDNNLRYEAFKKLLALTEQNVSWVYDYWQILVDKLSSENSFQRSIGLLLLANLTRSDSEDKFSEIIERYLSFFEDDKFITSRQCIQNVWKIAVNKEACKEKIVNALKNAYFSNLHLTRNEKLIKQDVIFSLNRISEFYKDKTLAKDIDDFISREDKKLAKSLQAVRLQNLTEILNSN